MLSCTHFIHNIMLRKRAKGDIMEQHSVLFDLKIAMNNGFCGIGTENRLIFNMLSKEERLSLSGLLVSNQVVTTLSKYQKLPANQGIPQANQFFHEALGQELLVKNKLKMKFKMHYWKAFKRHLFDLYEIDQTFYDAIWRNVFDKTLAAQSRELISNKKFYFSNLAQLHLTTASYFNYSLPLNTESYDFAVFMEPLPVKVSPNTKKIVRFHDAIPISDPDFTGARFSKGKINVLNQCAEDSYFVCNSVPTRDVLLTIKPELEERSCVIPCVILDHQPQAKNFPVLKQILSVRLSKQLVSEKQIDAIRARIDGMQDLDYFFHLATLDPKKNQVTLIKAWEKVHYQSGGKLKLIIAANKGWQSEEIEELMRPHIEMGNIIHLANLSNEDVPYLYAHAKAFIFPSYTEGFGLPPLEAMQSECPVIVSDIKTHRWVYGEAALYANPYDVDELVHQMQRLLNDEQGVLRQDLIEKGLRQAKQYSPGLLADQWVNLFDSLRKS